MGLVAKVSPASGSPPCKGGMRTLPGRPGYTSGRGFPIISSESATGARSRRPGPRHPPPNFSPPSLPVLLAAGTQQGAECQARCRGSCPGQIHDQPSVFGCPRTLPPPPPTSPPSGPCAAATSANLPCVIASSGRRWEGVGGGGGGGGRRWEGAGKEAEGGDARWRPDPGASQPLAHVGRAVAGMPSGPGGGGPSSSPAPVSSPSDPPLHPRRSISDGEVRVLTPSCGLRLCPSYTQCWQTV